MTRGTRRKAPGKPKAGRAKVLPSSEARASFSETLETAQVDNTVIGLERYGRTVAALVPVEAIYILAGQGDLIDVRTREEIIAGAQLFAHNVPYTREDETDADLMSPPPAAKPKSKSKSQRRPTTPASRKRP